MLIEEAFSDFIKHLNSGKKTQDSDLMCNDFINNTQLIDISGIMGSYNKEVDIKNVCNPFRYTFIKVHTQEKTLILGDKSEIYFFIIDGEVPCKYCSSIIFFHNNTLTLNYNIDIVQEKDGISIIPKSEIVTIPGIDLKSNIKGTVKDILSALEKISYSTHDLYKTSSRKIVFKNRKTKEKIKVEKPIYIYLNKKNSESKIKSIPDYKGRKIERLFSWNVRGHWRRLDDPRKRGKNSEGKYIVEGYTWVKPHICGNKDLPPKQQTYIVIDKSK